MAYICWERIEKIIKGCRKMGNCCVCGNKLGFFTNGGMLAPTLEICEKCYENKRMLMLKEDSSKEDIEKSHKAREYFEQYLSSENMDNEIKEIVRNLINNSQKSEEQHYEYKSRQNIFMTTTGYNFEGYRIAKYMNIVNGEIVLGTGFLSELSASVTDVFGTTSSTFQGKIGKAKAMALENMTKVALSIGANAIIGIDFDITTLSNNIIAVSVNGTAVKIEKNEE